MYKSSFTFRRLGWICVLLLFGFAIAGLSLALSSQAQTESALEKKADVDLKRFYQLYRRQPGVAPNVAQQRERVALKKLIGYEERGDSAVAGVSIKLRDASVTAQQEVEAAGFQLRARIGDIAVLDVTADDLPRLANVSAIEAIYSSHYAYPEKLKTERITSRKQLLKAMNDAANLAVRANDARTMFNVTGRGVIVGVIDTGADWRHGDFRKADGTTRIKFMWDISDSAGTGPGNLGRVYTESEINAALQSGGGVGLVDTEAHGRWKRAGRWRRSQPVYVQRNRARSRSGDRQSDARRNGQLSQRRYDGRRGVYPRPCGRIERTICHQPQRRRPKRQP